ncbi:MAG: 30S ribosomal protein S1 [Anaerolineae bacterium]
MNEEQSADLSSHPMAFLLEGDFGLRVPKAGEICNGHIVSVSGNHILVDIGAKSEGLVDPREIDQMSADEKEALEMGAEVKVLVTNPEDSRGTISLSIAQALTAEEWANAKALLESGEEIEIVISGRNRGGLLTQIGHLRAFVPASQLGLAHHEVRNDQTLAQFQGQTIRAKVIEVDSERNRLILSSKDAAGKAKKAKRLEKISNIEEGKILPGHIVNIERFGVFVDIGGIQGLVHLSELSWSRISNPEELYSVGDAVEVFVLNIDEEKARIALSIKRLLDDPWKEADGIYTEGEFVPAVITKLEKYGAFAEIQGAAPIEGLIHLSEISEEERIEHPSQIIDRGDKMMVKIIKIDMKKRQLGLSLIGVPEDLMVPEDEDEEEEPLEDQEEVSLSLDEIE